MVGMVKGGSGPLDFRYQRRAAEGASEVNNTVCLDLLTVQTEAASGLKALRQGTGNSVLQSLDVELEILVDLLVPEIGDSLEIGDECVNGSLAGFPGLVDCFLEVHPAMLHKNRYGVEWVSSPWARLMYHCKCQ